MQPVVDFLRGLYSSQGIEQLIQTGGLAVLMAIIFSETGLLLGFFLPGDSLLVAAGVVSAKMGEHAGFSMNIWTLNILLAIIAIVGDQVGYLLGYKTGPKIFSREDSLLFKKKHAVEAHEFYMRYGGLAVILARFMPIFRTFVPFIAGVAVMPYRRFLCFDIAGGSLWISSMVWLGYGLGQTPYAKDIHHIIIIVVVVSFLPIIIGFARRMWLAKKQ